jgi:serine/threonine protein kinase
LDRYEKLGRVGEGTYGVVYKAKDKETNQFVALKRCIPHHESSDGFPQTSE